MTPREGAGALDLGGCLRLLTPMTPLTEPLNHSGPCVLQKTASGIHAALGLKGKGGPPDPHGFSATVVRKGFVSSPCLQCCGAVSRSSHRSAPSGACSLCSGVSKEKCVSPSRYSCPFTAGRGEGVRVALSSCLAEQQRCPQELLQRAFQHCSVETTKSSHAVHCPWKFSFLH